ncbi:putative reverse transcriptase domain-containing protein [Tanacetum coccineum]
MSAAAISKLVADEVAKALEADRASRTNPNVARGSGGNAGQGGAPPIRECSFAGFMKCGPTQFHVNGGVVELCRWFEKTESVFGISECAERSKVKFAAATPQRSRLDSGTPKWMRGNELRSLKLRDTNIAAYTQRFNELALLCPEAVPTEKKKVELYIKGLPENIKGETTSSRPTVLNEAVRMAHTLMEQKIQDKAERVAKNNKRKWESNNNQSGNNNNRNNYQDNTRHHQYNNRRQGNARAMTTTPAEQGGHTGNKPLCNHCMKHHFGYCTIVCNRCGRTGHIASNCKVKAVATGANAQPIMTCYGCGEKGHTKNHCPKRNNPMLFDSGSDKSFVNTSLSHLIDIKPVRLNTSYEVELADRRIHDAVIVCGKKEVHIPVKNEVLVVKGNEERHLEDVRVVCEFPEVFPDDLPGLPPPRQVEFKIELVPGAAPVARAPYHLASSEMKELSDQLKELSEK